MLTETQPSASIHPFISSEVIKSYEESKFVILPIPYEATTSYRKGTQNGPTAILEASDQLEAYDDELDREYCLDCGIFTVEPIADTRFRQVTAEQMLAETSTAVTRYVQDGKFLISLGGEHSITAGIVQGYKNCYAEPFTVVQIDAHGDMRHSYEGTIHSHACVMRRVLEMGLPTLPVGIRAICKEEADLIKEQQIPVIWARNIANDPQWIPNALSQIKTRKVFLTIDLDGIDPSSMEGVGTPVAGGLSWYGLLDFIRQLFQSFEVIGADVMELAPVVDSVVSQFTSAQLVYKLVNYYAESQKW